MGNSTLEMLLRASDPAAPNTGYGAIYVQAPGLYHIDDLGNVTGPLIDIASVTADISAHLLDAHANSLTNYIITPSVASNNLTVALKTLAGTDPSAADPITHRIGNAVYDITAALSLTAAASTNWCSLGTDFATIEQDLFVYLIAETGAAAGVKIGFSRIAYALTMGDFNAGSTHAKHIKGNWTTLTSTDAVALIGRFSATLSAGAAYTWTLPSPVVVNWPIYETRWRNYIPSVLPGSGTITTLGALTSSMYKLSYDVMYVHQDINITTNGTGASYIAASLPMTGGAAMSTVGVGREINVTGSLLQGIVSASQVNWNTYNNLYPGGSGYHLICDVVVRMI